MKSCVSFILLFLGACGGGGAALDDGGVGLDAAPLPDKPASLPTYASLSLFSADSALNQPIAADATVDPASDSYVEGFTSAGGLLIQLRQYSSPVYVADATTPTYDVVLPCGRAWELGTDALLGVPIPNWAEPSNDVDGAGNPVRAGRCSASSDQDNFMVVLDLATRCEYDLWQARRVEGGWEASWASALSMDSDGIHAHGLSSRGSGFAWLGGVIWPDELAAGRIEHALVFSYPFTLSGGPVSPATESDGEINRSFALPEGAHVRLDPSLDLDALGLVGAERTVAEAMQVYGLYLVDNGGDSGMGLYAVDPSSVMGDPYAGLLPDVDYPSLPKIPLDKLQTLTLGPQNAAFQDTIALEVDACNRYR
jgi:hypothetical protein